MALFKIEKGLAADLAGKRPNTTEGYCYVTTDDGKFYIDTVTGDGVSGRIVLNAGSADKLSVGTIGSEIRPIYFKNGVPTIVESDMATQNYVDNAIAAIDVSDKLSKNGDTMLGVLALQDNLILTENVHYGTTLPSEGVEGQLFFLDDDGAALPPGGTKGQILVKKSDKDNDAGWADGLKGAAVGQSENSAENPWYKIGECIIAEPFIDSRISFKVSEGYNDLNMGNGILSLHIRTGENVTFEHGEINWEYAGSGINIEDWVLGYKTDENGYLNASLWARLDIGYSSFHLSVLQEHNRLESETRWNLFNTFTNGSYAAIPEELTQIISSYGEIHGSKVYGAVYNDYAEFRILKENNQIPYGRVVIENGDDTLSLSTNRLQAGGNICSDTFGFAIGETAISKMPIAVSGRVLAYPYEDRNSYKPGDAVCTGPQGTVSKMTREEIKEYPDRIIGYVSAIPNYQIWGSENIVVNNRIWVKVV